jgi:hypothetical protein
LIICKIDEIQSKNNDRNEEDIPENLIPEFDDMLGPEVSPDEHTDTKREGSREVILALYQDSDETPDKPKN